jgi:hypothetical protein
MRAVAIGEGVSRAGLAAALLMAQGVPAWIRSWRACTPPPLLVRAPARAAASSDLVDVLAGMALACT